VLQVQDLVLQHYSGSLVVAEVHQILDLVQVKVVVLVVLMLVVEMHYLVQALLRVD
tara:strand:- start:138 stop:305 length:168 start_codon:yes stop_codon:yes gene_type:complete